jgi:acetyl esterase/lipase
MWSLMAVASIDIVVARAMGVWARLYAPAAAAGNKVPVVVYFHGGGFGGGSATWSCYHEFLAQLPARTTCVVMTVDYRLEPENRTPAAFDDGLAAVRQQAGYLMGDSTGVTIVFHIAARLGEGGLGTLATLSAKGAILIQRFFGGEARTKLEKTPP